MTKKKLKDLPIYYFKNEENCIQNWRTLKKLPCSSRGLPDFLCMVMLQACEEIDLSCLFIPHWHQIANDKDDGRSIRNMLEADSSGNKPKRKSSNFDLLRYIDICLQYYDDEYAAYVQEWCHRQVMCLDEGEDDL